MFDELDAGPDFGGIAEPGTCSVCGCDDDHACDGGCIWANADATLCSRCAQSEETSEP